ncbi:hypothetical protein BpHYR1_007967 [Brachionus plicatilis]|uniref:Uncharacterized protein n=1 Tax=Brachionus plicatilis TaxID=10195 RepID=A0A3M7R9W1_BRAPC|nr:hypothetical protein BpHYR1_007967 [Brachionus plicatilis]
MVNLKSFSMMDLTLLDQKKEVGAVGFVHDGPREVHSFVKIKEQIELAVNEQLGNAQRDHQENAVNDHVLELLVAERAETGQFSDIINGRFDVFLQCRQKAFNDAFFAHATKVFMWTAA